MGRQRQTQHPRQGLRRLARPLQIARYDDVEPLSGQCAGQRAGLTQPFGVQADVDMALQAPFGIPGGLAMAYQYEFSGGHGVPSAQRSAGLPRLFG